MTANVSYISAANQYEELWEFLDQPHVYQLVANTDSSLEETLTDPLIAEQQSRLNRALNWARNEIDNALREVYVVETLTSATAPDTLKRLNARLAQNFLERRKQRAAEACSDLMTDLQAELQLLARESTSYSLAGVTRRSGAVATAIDSKVSQFDRPNQFDNIIPERESEDIWPDGANE